MVLVPSALSAAISSATPARISGLVSAYRPKWLLEIVAVHHHPVRVAQDDLRAHVDQFVREEQAALEHLLVDEHAAFGSWVATTNTMLSRSGVRPGHG